MMEGIRTTYTPHQEGGLVFQTSGTRFLAARNSSVVLDNSCEQTDSAASVRTRQGKSAMLPFPEAACHSGSMA